MKKKYYETKTPCKYLPEHLQGWNFLNSTLMAVCEKDGASAQIEDDVLIVKLRCGVTIKVENFIGNKDVQPDLDFSKCYKKPFIDCPHEMGFNCFNCQVI